MQPGDGTIWTEQSVAETGRGPVTVECIQAGEAAFPLGQSSTSSQELRDYNNDIVSLFCIAHSHFCHGYSILLFEQLLWKPALFTCHTFTHYKLTCYLSAHLKG